MLTVLFIIILIFSVIVHEVSHGYMADLLGDPTARLQGRLTLNPLKHIDPVGSIIVPIITSFAGFTFGWAKPVVYNPYNLKDRRKGEFLIAAAGPLSNLSLAIIFGLLIRYLVSGAGVVTPFAEFASYIVIINIVLAVFNLVPVPPLDGSKLFLAFLPDQYGQIRMIMERYGPILVLIVILFVWQVISPIVPYLFQLITGISMG
ncbi:MAG: site-2 protease family protein [Candidatus Taylorbacteria bacterium]